MKLLFFTIAILGSLLSSAQTKINSKKYGAIEFKELEHGLAVKVDGTTEKMKNSPTGTHGWLTDLEIVSTTDSIKIIPKANFGVIYIFEAKDTMDIEVTIEWIYPKQVINGEGEKFKSIKYTTTRPTNIPSGSTYSLDESYEMVPGKWIENIYLENKKVMTRSFILY